MDANQRMLLSDARAGNGPIGRRYRGEPDNSVRRGWQAIGVLTLVFIAIGYVVGSRETTGRSLASRCDATCARKILAQLASAPASVVGPLANGSCTTVGNAATNSVLKHDRCDGLVRTTFVASAAGKNIVISQAELTFRTASSMQDALRKLSSPTRAPVSTLLTDRHVHAVRLPKHFARTPTRYVYGERLGTGYVVVVNDAMWRTGKTRPDDKVLSSVLRSVPRPA